MLNDPPLNIGEKVSLDVLHSAHFDGQFVVIENPLGVRLRISPIMMAHLFDFNRRVCESFVEKWAIDLSELP